MLWKIRQVMAEFPRDYQLLVADDASTDKTSEVLTPYARVLPLTVVRTDQRRGYASSLEMLLREAVRRSEYPKRDVIITIQADFSQEPEDIIPIIKRMEAGADIVVGEATLPPETVWKVRWSRRMSAKLLGRKSVPQGVKDPFTGFSAYRVFTVKKAMEEKPNGRLLLHDGWAANAELLAATAPHARRVEPLDVTVRPHRLQRASRLHPWPALKNVWAYARKAKPEIEAATTMELDDSVATGATSRSNDVASVRERMSERSDMHGNRSPHGDRQPHNARTERPRYERPSRPGRPEKQERSNGERSRPQSEPRARIPAEPRARTPAEPRERKPQNPPRERKQRMRPEPVAPTIVPMTAPAADAATPIVAGAEPASVQPSSEPTKRRRRRGRRSRGGANRNTTNGAEGDVIDAVEAAPSAGEAEVVMPARNENNGAEGDVVHGAEDAIEAVVANGDGTAAKKRRRGRRGGRGRRRQGKSGESGGADGSAAEGPSGEGMSGEGSSGEGSSGDHGAINEGPAGVISESRDTAAPDDTRGHDDHEDS